MIGTLGWTAWATLGVMLALIVALVREVTRPDLAFLGALGLLLAFGVLSPEEAFAGLSNRALVAVGALFVVAAGVHRTGALTALDPLLFARSGSLAAMLGRLMFTTASLSAFLNNTPIVAMLIPRVEAWGERIGVPASKLMIPLSYAAIVGGMTTLIGTSTNLLVAGLMTTEGYDPIGFFDLSLIGVPAAICVILYMATLGHRLLPKRTEERPPLDRKIKNCLFELRVAAHSPLTDHTIEEAGLRSLEDAYLAHLRRGEKLIPSSPDFVLQAGDVLTFQGSTSVLSDLLKRPGLERTVTHTSNSNHATLPLYEAVVAPSSELVGKTLREVDFRERYQGVVLGIHRRDETIEKSLGRTTIRPGDQLLIEAPNGFEQRWSENRDEFYLVAPREETPAPRARNKAPLALAILAGVIVVAAAGFAPIAATAFIGALAILATGCLPLQEARQAVNLPILLIIAAALGLGTAIEKTGLADVLASGIIGAAAPLGIVGTLAGVYLATSILTELITNNGAAALMLSIALSVADQVGAPPKALALTVAIAASASFMTPIGYQTNLMVMSTGGYRFTDYMRSGVVVDMIVATCAITMIWLVWF